MSDSEEWPEFTGACGKILRGLCYPDFIDDLCASCQLNAYSEENQWAEDD